MMRLKRKYCRKSLNQFTLENPVRLAAIHLVERPLFDKLIIVLIALNSVLLGMQDYTWEEGRGPVPFGSWLVEESELFFTVCFTFESFVKILAHGLIFTESCYLRDGWNWLDFTVVVTALIQNLPGVTNVSSLRTFRLFRPLRSLSAVPSMKLLVSTLFLSFRQLSNILILDLCFILTFAVFGLQMWSGVVHQRCRLTPHPVDGDWPLVVGDERVCGSFHQCESGTFCGSLFETTLPDRDGNMITYELRPDVAANLYRDSVSRGQNFGITSFDNIASSYLTVAQCTTLEGWTGIMKII